MARWRWFQRRNEPIDRVGETTAYPDRAGAYRRQSASTRVPDDPPGGPAWNGPTVIIPRNHPLLLPGQAHRASFAFRNRRGWSKNG